MLYCAAAARPIQNWDIIWEHNCTVQKKQGEKKRNGWKFCEIFLGKTRHFHELLLPYESHLLWGEECRVLKTLKSFVFLLRGQFKVQNFSLISFFVKNIHISKTQDSRTSSMSTVPIPSADFSSPTRLRVTFFAPSSSLIPRLLIFLDCIQSPRGVETLVEVIEYEGFSARISHSALEGGGKTGRGSTPSDRPFYCPCYFLSVLRLLDPQFSADSGGRNTFQKCQLNVGYF